MINQTFQERVDFFFANAGYSYNPATQSEFAGRLCCAMALADAEEWCESIPELAFNWNYDGDSSDADNAGWVCLLMTVSGDDEVLEALGGIDLGMVEPDAYHSNPYQRVVEAQLAIELLVGSRQAALARTSDDYDHCTRDGVGRTQDHPDFDPTVDGPLWSRS